MLANHYVNVHEAEPWADHICTGWKGFDDDMRMLCTVAEAIRTLQAEGVSRGVLALIQLGSWVEMRTDLRQPNLGVGKVVGVRDGKLVVQWRKRPEGEVSHHLVRFTDGPPN